MLPIRSIILLLSLIAVIGACKSDDRVIPTDFWSGGCVQLAPEVNGYRLSGMCCAYLKLPIGRLKAGSTRTVESTYSSFTGAGYADQRVLATVEVSKDNDRVKIAFLAGTRHQVYELVPGKAQLSCLCLCD